ncbi:MAG: hypothetical protein U1E73_12495 [Planctomycetota bacterium]
MQQALATSFLLAAILTAQDPPKTPETRKANAADLYRLALDDVQRRFGIASDDLLALPEADMDADEPFTAAECGEAIERAGNALELFAQAAHTPDCHFGPGREPPATAYDEDCIRLYQLALLTSARGFRACDRDPGRAAADANTALCFARHVFAQTSLASAMMGQNSERLGLRLVAAAAATLQRTADSARIERCRADLALHAGARPSLAKLAANEAANALLAVDMVFRERESPIGGDPNAPVGTFLTANRTAVRARFAALVDEAMAPLHADPQPGAAAIGKRAKELAAAWKRDADRQRIERDFAKLTDEQRTDALAKMFALLLLPDVGRMAREEEENRALMQRCGEALTLPAKGR